MGKHPVPFSGAAGVIPLGNEEVDSLVPCKLAEASSKEHLLFSVAVSKVGTPDSKMCSPAAFGALRLAAL